MFARFFAEYPPDSDLKPAADEVRRPSELRQNLGGSSFAGGVYRMHTVESASAVAPVLQVAFPDAPPHDLPFAYDWLGRQFCARADDPGATVLLFEPGSGECFDVPVAFSDFHDVALVDDGDGVLATGYFADHRAAGGAAPTVTECVGFKIPLFLGGRDDFSNLELTDMDVYLEVMGQVLQQVRGLPPGTPIGGVTIGD